MKATKPAKVGLQLLAVPVLMSSCVAFGGDSMGWPWGLLVLGVWLLWAGSPRELNG